MRKIEGCRNGVQSQPIWSQWKVSDGQRCCEAEESSQQVHEYFSIYFILFFRMNPILSLICLPIKREKSMVVDLLLNDNAIHFDFLSQCVSAGCVCVSGSSFTIKYTQRAESYFGSTSSKLTSEGRYTHRSCDRYTAHTRKWDKNL